MIELGLITTVVTLVPGANAPWKRTGTVAQVGRIAAAADEPGFHHPRHPRSADHDGDVGGRITR